MLLLALMDGAKAMLEWVDMYGADKVFMVLFFIMYLRAQKRLSTQADARLADSKEALQALIEAKYVFGELVKSQEDMSVGQDEIKEQIRLVKHHLEKEHGVDYD